MDVRPLISVIVPVYNVEKYINKCVDSILSQEFKDFELILVDDGSPDRCGEICNDYALMDARVKVIHQNNKGLASARNSGIAIAEGKYLAFVDSDDWIAPQMYELLYTAAEKEAAEIAVCNFFMTNKDRNLDLQEGGSTRISIQSGKRAVFHLYEENALIYTVVWNKLYRKELFAELKFPDGRIHEDEFVNYKLFYKCRKVAIVRKKLYYYRQRPDSIMHQTYRKNRLDRYLAFEERMNFFLEKKEYRLYEKTLHFYMVRLFEDTKICRCINAGFQIQKDLYFLVLKKSIPYLRASRIPIGEKGKLFLFLFNPFCIPELSASIK